MDKFAYQGNDLGVTYCVDYTSFKVWAPSQEKISLILYDDFNSEHGKTYDMEKNNNGIWQLTLNGYHRGKYYNYIIKSKDKYIEVTDPYTKGASANSKRGMIIDLKGQNPQGWERHFRPFISHYSQGIIYETHIRDFTMDENSAIHQKGKFLGFTEKNTKTPNGNPTGLDHLKELGITHIHFLPIFDFITVDEEKSNEYNWGYDPHLYNVPEGSYASDPYHGEIRIYELKKMIQTLHEEGIGVIMDVVYNHSYYTKEHPFELLVPGYFYRQNETGEFSNGSGVGNELATERFMVQKYIIDSLCFWAKEYQIDGFRFDLMALHDRETMHMIEKELKKINSNIIIYGEPWMGGPSSLPESLQFNKGKQRGSQIAIFNDDFRNAIKGDNDGGLLGLVNGGEGLEREIKKGIIGSIYYSEEIQGIAQEPVESINYVSCHDNLTLFDKIEKTAPHASLEEKIRMNILALSIILTSQGIPFIHGGAEIFLSKKGNHNSYNAGDEINKIDWSNKDRYQNYFEYIKNLISFRKSQKVMSLSKAEDIKEAMFFLKTPSNVIAYRLKSPYKEDYKDIIIIHNANRKKEIITLPNEEKWIIIANQYEVNNDGITKEKNICTNTVIVEGISTYILVQK